MPQFMWEGLFPILYVLVPGVVMALFAAYYQNRRKKEIQIEGKLAIERIDGYVKIFNFLYEAQDLRNPTLEEETRAQHILCYFDVPVFRFEYPAAFTDQASFESFYSRMVDLRRNYEIYLDDPTIGQLNKSTSIYTQMKLWLDAFCDTEHTVELNLKESVARHNIDWMYKLAGMMLFSICTESCARFEQMVNKQLNHFSLTYRKHRLCVWFRKRRDVVLHWFDTHSRKNGLWAAICRIILLILIGRDGRSKIHIIKAIVAVMTYVHFSDRYTPKEFFEKKRLPKEDELALFGKVFMAMVHTS